MSNANAVQPPEDVIKANIHQCALVGLPADKALGLIALALLLAFLLTLFWLGVTLLQRVVEDPSIGLDGKYNLDRYVRYLPGLLTVVAAYVLFICYVPNMLSALRP